MAVNVRETVQAFDEDLEVVVAKDKMGFEIQAAADYDWSALFAFVKARKSSHLSAYRLDDHAANYRALPRPHAKLPARQRAEQQALWAGDVLFAPVARAELGLVLRVRTALDPTVGTGVHDPRLEEVRLVARAAELLWRARLGDEHFEQLARMHAASSPFGAKAERQVTAREVPHPSAVQRRRLGMQAITGNAQYRWEKVGQLAWRRVAQVLDEVASHAEGIVKKGRGSVAGRERYRRTASKLRELQLQAEQFVARKFH